MKKDSCIATKDRQSDIALFFPDKLRKQLMLEDSAEITCDGESILIARDEPIPLPESFAIDIGHRVNYIVELKLITKERYNELTEIEDISNRVELLDDVIKLLR